MALTYWFSTQRRTLSQLDTTQTCCLLKILIIIFFFIVKRLLQCLLFRFISSEHKNVIHRIFIIIDSIDRSIQFSHSHCSYHLHETNLKCKKKREKKNWLTKWRFWIATYSINCFFFYCYSHTHSYSYRYLL